jgi:thioesterase domain-containing protein/acyl carrier protein
MIPSFFITLERLPLTANGKVDRKALPEPHGAISASVEYIAPSNEAESIMVEIWQEVLNVDKIGIDHNFFEMGGHSLKLINLVSRVYEAFDVELSPKQVLEAPTIRQMAEKLAKGDYKDQHPLMLLNNEQEKKIFCFPPVGGYGLVYKSLADISQEYSYYSFNYIDDSGSNLYKYVDYIVEVQKEGPYTLMGWSAGGNLAFEVAKEMERQGHKVTDIILVDVHRMVSNLNLPKEEIQKMVNDNLKLAMEDEFYKDYLSKNEFIRNRVASKMEDYFTYLRNEMINSGDVSSNIHVIYSTDQVPPEHDLRGDWHRVTTGKFTKYQGVGSHPYMLYSGFVEENLKIVRQILDNK